MGEGLDQRRQEAERLRDYFDVQIQFAEILARRMSMPLSDAHLVFTNLHRRFGLGKVQDGAPAARWVDYALGSAHCADSAQRLDWAVDFFADSTPAETGNRRFGCFSYEKPDQDGAVHIHFNNRDSDDTSGPLARAKTDRRQSELREMFGFIRANHPQAQRVRGGSWLYNIDAYRRLFPPAYVASAQAPGKVRLDGTSSWGQVLDFRGGVKSSVRSDLLARASLVDPASPWVAFPLPALAADCAIGQFYQHYRC